MGSTIGGDVKDSTEVQPVDKLSDYEMTLTDILDLLHNADDIIKDDTFAWWTKKCAKTWVHVPIICTCNDS